MRYGHGMTTGSPAASPWRRFVLYSGLARGRDGQEGKCLASAAFAYAPAPRPAICAVPKVVFWPTDTTWHALLKSATTRRAREVQGIAAGVPVVHILHSSACVAWMLRPSHQLYNALYRSAVLCNFRCLQIRVAAALQQVTCRMTSPAEPDDVDLPQD